MRRHYDRDPKSDRILGVIDATSAGQTAGATIEPPIEVVLGWFEELKRLVPGQ